MKKDIRRKPKMPVVLTKTTGLHGKPFKLKINYSPKRKLFYINLPDYMASVLGKKEVSMPLVKPMDRKDASYDPQHSVEIRFNEAVKEYDALVESKQEVIFYTFKSRIKPIEFPGNTDEIHSDDEMFSAGIALDLWFSPGYITKHPVDDEVIFHDLTGKKIGTSQWLNRDWKYLSYTPEREAFFTAFRDYLKTGITKMKDFFAQEIDVIAQLIDSGMTPALPAPVSNHKEDTENNS
jgi:hypothetical protein